MATRNAVTGDKIQSKVPSQSYKDNYDAIFGKKEKSDASENKEAATLHGNVLDSGGSKEG